MKERSITESKVDIFLGKLKELGVDPIIFPDIQKAYHDLNTGGSCNTSEILYERINEMKKQAQQHEQPKPSGLTFEQYMNVFQHDIDVCVVDKDTGGQGHW